MIKKFDSRNQLRMSALLAVAATLNLNVQAFAQSAGGGTQSGGSLNLNLSSTNKSVLAPLALGAGAVTIKSGTAVMNVTGQTMLTPAEHLAVLQVVSSGAQSIKLGASGNAIGGSFNLSPGFSNFSNLVIPKGVTSLSSATNLNILGDLANSGIMHIATAQNVLATINANNIVNNVGALISSTSALNLVAANNIVNQGQIIGANSLSFTAGNSITNAATSTLNSGVISAAGNLSLNAANLVNSGSIASLNGNINISSQLASNIVFNNTNGTLSALNGDINVRDALFTGKYNFNLVGGDVFSNQLNIWSGKGNADLSVNNITSLINATASNIHVQGNTPDLRLGNLVFSEDPTFYNSGGNIQITSAINSASAGGVVPGVAIVASGSVTSSLVGSVIDTAIGAAPNPAAGLIIIAGANFTVTGDQTTTGVVSGVLTPPGNTAAVLTLNGASTTGGMIDFGTTGNISTAAPGIGNNIAGPVTLAAFAGTLAQSGAVRVGNITTGSGSSSASNGNVTIIAGAKTDPSASFTAITTGNITTDVNKAPLGGVLLVTGKPEVTGGQFQIVNGVVAGLNTAVPSASLGSSSVNANASITTGSISTNIAPITLVAGSNVNLNGNITTNGVLPQSGTGFGPGGNLTVIAGGNISGTVSSISTTGLPGPSISIPSNAGGDVLLLAGANAQATVTHTFTGDSTTVFQTINADFVTASLTVTGASASGGNISLTSLSSINTQAGATTPQAPINNIATGGNVTLAAFSSTSAPATTGLITLSSATTTTSINTGGSALAVPVSFTGDLNSGTSVTSVSDTSKLANGAVITGPGIPNGTTIVNGSITANSFTLSQPATVTATTVTLAEGATQSLTNNTNGDVTIIAAATTGVGTPSITLGTATKAISIDTSGGNEGRGNITIVTSSPSAALPFSYSYNYSAGQAPVKDGSLSPSANLKQSDITINGTLKAVGGSFQVGTTQDTHTTDITVKSGGNLTIGQVTNTNNTLPPGGPPASLPSSTIRLEAGSAMNINGAITSSAGSLGADGGTIILKAASYTFPNGQQLVSADGTGGYTLNSDPLNFTGNVNGTDMVDQVFTTVNGTGLVIGTSVTDNAGNTIIPAGSTLISIVQQGTQAIAVLTSSSANVKLVTVGLSTGVQVAGGAIEAGTTITIAPSGGETSGSPTGASVEFTGDTDIQSNQITNVVVLGGSTITNLLPGTPLVGPGVPAGATIASASGNTVVVAVPGGGNLTGTFSGQFAQAGTGTLSNAIGATGGGDIVLVAANGQIQLNQTTLGGTLTGVAVTDNLPVGQSGGNGGNISITTTSAAPVAVGSSAFKVSALGAALGGNGGVVTINSGSSISVNPADLTAQPSLNGLVDAGFNTLITTGYGPTFNFTAATTLFINGSLNANGAPSTLAGNLGSPSGSGGVINIDVTSAVPFNIGGALAGGNGVLTGGTLTANGNVVTGTTAGFGDGGTINIINRGTGTATAPSGIIVAAGALQVKAAPATDGSNLGASQQSYIGGAGGNIILNGQAVQSLGSLDANGGAASSIRGSGDGGTISIETNYTSTANPSFTVDPTASPTTTLNGVIGTLNAKGNVPGAVPSGLATVITTQPTGNGGTISLKNKGGGIKIGATASMSVAAANANALLGTIGGNGGTIQLTAGGTATTANIQSAIGLSANGGNEAAPAATAVNGTVNNGVNVPITFTAAATGFYEGQAITLQTSPLGGPAEGVLVKSVDSPTQITVWQVVAAPPGGYTGSSVQSYFSSGNGGNISLTTNSSSKLTVNNGTTGNFINGTLQATGFNGGTIEVTNNGTGGINVGSGSIFATAQAPSNIVGPTLVGQSGFGGNISLMATGVSAEVVVASSLRVDGATIAPAQLTGPNNGGLGGNLTIVSNSTSPFVVGAAVGALNGIINGQLSANGGAGVGATNNAGTITIVNLGGGITIGSAGVNAPVLSAGAISIAPGVKTDGSIGTVGTPGNGGSLTLTAPAANSAVFVAGGQGINLSGNTQHASNVADGLGGSLSITCNTPTTNDFIIGAGTTNGTAGPINANGWSGGSVSIINRTGDIILNNTGGNVLTVTPNNANPAAVGIGGIQLAGGPGGTISLQAPKGIVAITGGLVVDGGKQAAGELNPPNDPYFLQGGNGGQISILSGAGIFNVGGAVSGASGSTGVLSAQGATGGIIHISAGNGGDIVVSNAASINVSGYAGVTCTQCNNTIPAGNPPTDLSVAGGNGGRIYLQANTAGGTVFIAGTAATGGLNASGGSKTTAVTCNACTNGPHDGNGGTISIVSNSTVKFNIGAAATNTNGLGSGGSILNASGYNGGSIGIKNQGTGGIGFDPSLISVSSAKGALATLTDFPGGNGGIIDMQAPAGKLGATVNGSLNASGTSSPQGFGHGGTITLAALQIDESLANLSLSASGAQVAGNTATGGTVIISQTISTVANTLTVGSAALTITVAGTPGSSLGGTIALSSPAGINIAGNLQSDSAASGTINLNASGKNGITQTPGSSIKTSTLNLLVGDTGAGTSGLTTNIQTLSLKSSGKIIVNNTVGNLTVSSAQMDKAVDLNIISDQGNLTVASINSPGNVSLSASGVSTLFGNSGNIFVTGNILASKVTMTANSGDGATGGGIFGTGPALVSANSIVLNPTITGVNLNTSTGSITVNTSGSFGVLINNTGNLLLSLGTTSAVGVLAVRNIGSITTLGNFNQVGAIALDNVPGLGINGVLVAGSNVFNASDLSSLIPGSTLQGVGVPAGTTVGGINGSIGFLGNLTAGSSVINSLSVQNGPGILGTGAIVTSGPDLPDGTTIVGVSNGFGTGGSSLAPQSANLSILNNVPLGLGLIAPGIDITGTGLPAGSTINSVTPGFNFSGNNVASTNVFTNVPASTPGLQNGVQLIGAGIPNSNPGDGIVTNVSAPVSGFVTVTFSGTSTTPGGTGVGVGVNPYFTVDTPSIATLENGQSYAVAAYAVVSAPANSTVAAGPILQSAYAVLSQPANVSVATAAIKQLSSTVSGNSQSITLGGNLGSTNLGSITINAGGSIIQNSGLISGSSILLTSLNGNIGTVTRTFTNNIYTPAGTSIKIGINQTVNSLPGNIDVITTNPFNGSSPGTVNLSITGSDANIDYVQAGGDVLIQTTNLGNTGTLNVVNQVTSTFGAITLLNTNATPSSTTGIINVGANMIAGGGPLVIQNNNSGAGASGSINVTSPTTAALTLSGVGWFLNGLGGANVINSASTTSTTTAGLQAAVAIVTGTSAGAYPAPPLVSDGPVGNVTTNTVASTTVTLGSTGSLTANVATVVNATGASAVFQGANGAITLGGSGDININAGSSALVISTLDLTNAAQVANLVALNGQNGITSSTLTVSAGTLAIDASQATIPITLANLANINIAASQIVNFDNFGAGNPVGVNVATGTKNANVAGKISFLAVSGATPNSFSSDGYLFVNSNIIGQVLTVTGTVNSDKNLTVNAGGSVTVSGALTGGTNGTLGVFTGGANLASTTFTATTLPTGTLSLTNGGDLKAGQAANNSAIIVNAASIVSTGASVLQAGRIELAVGGSNWILQPVQIAGSQVAGISAISTSALSISSASGATVKLQLTGNTGAANLALNVGNSSVAYLQTPAVSISGVGVKLIGSLLAGSTVFSTSSKDLVVGTSIQGAGIPAGTIISSQQSAVAFSGDIGANGNVITNVADTSQLVVGGQIVGDAIPLGATITDIASGGVVTFLPSSTIPAAGTGVSFTQSSFAVLSNPATITVANASFKDFASPATLSTLSVQSATSISTGSNISCGSCAFATPSLTNLNTVSTNSVNGTVSIGAITTGALTITQTDGLSSGAMRATAGLTISGASNLSTLGGSFSTTRGTLSISQSGTGNLAITGSSFSAGSFNGTPLGPTILPTDVASSGQVSISEVGTGTLVISESAFNSIAGKISVAATQGSVSIQGVFQADGGNISILNSGTPTTITGSVFNANALGTAATNSVGGVVEISAGTNISQISTLSTVPGTVPSSPLFNQPDGPPLPLGSNVAINNNAGGSSVFPTGAISSVVSGTTAVLNVGNSPTAQTSLNLFGGGIVFNVTGASSLLMNGSVVSTNGYTPLAATTGGNSLDLEMDDPETSEKQAIAHVFTQGHKQAHVLTTHGFVDAGLAANLKAPKNNSEFRLRSGEMLLNPLSQTTIHVGQADIKVKKGALLAVSVDESGLRVTSCSGPGHVQVVIGEKTIALSPGEELIVSDHELSADEQLKADGIGRRQFSSYKLSSGMHASICEVSLFSLLSNWEHLASAKSTEQSDTHAVARAISHRILKTSAALTMLTQSRGAYQAKAKKPVQNDAPSFIPVNFTSNTRTKLRASAN